MVIGIATDSHPKITLRTALSFAGAAYGCGDDLSQDKRADAQFCREGCRKRSARHRRAGIADYG